MEWCYRKSYKSWLQIKIENAFGVFFIAAYDTKFYFKLSFVVYIS